MIKNFAIFKQEVKNEKSPTHIMSAKVGEEYVNIGACWTKDGNKGKFLSCTLQDAWVDHTDATKSRKAYMVVEGSPETPPEAQNAPIKVVDDETGSEIPF